MSRPAPAKKKVPINLSLEVVVKRAAARKCRAQGLSLSAVVNDFLRVWSEKDVTA